MTLLFFFPQYFFFFLLHLSVGNSVVNLQLGHLAPKGRQRIGFCRYGYVVLQAAAWQVNFYVTFEGIFFFYMSARTCSVNHGLAKLDAWGLQAIPGADSEPMFKGSKLLEIVRGGNHCLSDQYDKQFGD